MQAQEYIIEVKSQEESKAVQEALFEEGIYLASGSRTPKGLNYRWLILQGLFKDDNHKGLNYCIYWANRSSTISMHLYSGAEMIETADAMAGRFPWYGQLTPEMQNIIEKVRVINKEAAGYLSVNAAPGARYLAEALGWRSTPQGFSFWRNLCKQIRDMDTQKRKSASLDTTSQVIPLREKIYGRDKHAELMAAHYARQEPKKWNADKGIAKKIIENGKCIIRMHLGGKLTDKEKTELKQAKYYTN